MNLSLLRPWTFALLMLLAPGWSPAVAGNLVMVEERTEELDDINRQAVDAIPEVLPANAKIHIKADVDGTEGQNRVDLQEVTVLRTKRSPDSRAPAGQEGEGADGSRVSDITAKP